MPTPYLEKLHEDHGIPMKRLEEYWEKAKKIAEKGGKGYGYVVGILKNMLSISEHVSLSDSSHVPSWWKQLNTEQQKEYIRDHPGSKLSPMKHNPNDNKKKADEADEERPSAPSIMGEKSFNLRKIMRRKYLKRRAKIAHTIRHHKRGMSAIKTLVDGGNVNERDYEQAKTTAALGLKLVAVAAIGVIAFTAFAPLIGPLAQLFLTDHTGASFSSESSDSEDFAASLADKMYDWLSNQDQETLMARIEELKAKENSQ